ncbi:MAG: hypothetical protein NT013_27020 [Planctomycetia bacterium]|nr:hypothetical protein [Planctomycetia bacterium]
MIAVRRRLVAILLTLLALCDLNDGFVTATAADDVGYQKEVTVREATRMDWVFAVANQSRVDSPAEWLEGYESTKQRYELFVPPTSKANSKGKKGKGANNEGLPLVLFISPSEQPAGWSQLQAVCQQKGILFASPFNAGNNTPAPKRIRLVMDVLDDVRRHHKIDPDRTYLAGFSGGARIACGIGFSLPELIGGVMPVCAAGDLREEPWLRHRVIDRLSVAIITGTQDFNLGEVSRFRGPMLTEVGVRTKVMVVENLGHGIPDSKVFAEAIDWLDAGVADRRKLAQQYPASRIGSDSALNREQSAKALLEEGKLRLGQPKTLYAGLMQLQGIMQRWPDLKTAEDAKQLLSEYDARPEHPWEQDDITEQRRFLIARARSLDAYASGELPPQYANQRREMLEAAINLWVLVIQDGQNEKAVSEAEKRLPELKKRLQTP